MLIVLQKQKNEINCRTVLAAHKFDFIISRYHSCADNIMSTNDELLTFS